MAFIFKRKTHGNINFRPALIQKLDNCHSKSINAERWEVSEANLFLCPGLPGTVPMNSEATVLQ